MKLSRSLCLVPSLASLLLIPPGFGAVNPKLPAVNPPAVMLTPEQQKALQSYLIPQRPQTSLTPSLHGPGDVIPPCYMVYGLGTDAQGRGPFLDISGHALPINAAPRTVPVWQFRRQSAVKSPAKPH